MAWDLKQIKVGRPFPTPNDFVEFQIQTAVAK